MVSPMASDRLGWAWISRPTSFGQRLPVDRQVALVQQLAGPRPDHVEAQDRAVALRDHLHQAVGLAEDHRPAVAGHRVLVHLDVVARRAGRRPRSGPSRRPRDGCRRPTAPSRSRPAAGSPPGSAPPRPRPRRRRRAPGRGWRRSRRSRRPRAARSASSSVSTSMNPRSSIRTPAVLGPDALGDRAAPDRDQHLVDLDLVRALGASRTARRCRRTVCSSVPTRASAWIVVPALLQRAGQHVGAVAVGPDRQHAVRQRLQQRRVDTPRSV